MPLIPGRTWVAQVFPNPVTRLVVALCPGEVPNFVVGLLHPEERAFAMERRSGDSFREWVAGRYCLADALRPFAPKSPLLVRQSGAPATPSGVSSSISHKASMTVAIASAEFGGIGIDVDHIDKSDRDLQRKVLTRAEGLRLEQVGGLEARFVTMHFALKEAVYKAALDEEQEDLEFQDVELTMPQNALARESVWARVPITVAGSRCYFDGHILREGRWTLAIVTREPRQIVGSR